MKIAIPSDDGIFVAVSPSRATGFVVAEVALGEVIRVERRLHRPSVGSAHRLRRDAWRTRYVAVADTLKDCRTLIATSVGTTFRRLLLRRGLDVVVTSEMLVDRVIALFACLSLEDESAVDLESGEARRRWDLQADAVPCSDDEFDA